MAAKDKGKSRQDYVDHLLINLERLSDEEIGSLGRYAELLSNARAVNSVKGELVSRVFAAENREALSAEYNPWIEKEKITPVIAIVARALGKKPYKATVVYIKGD